MAASGNYITESDVSNWPVAIDATEDFETTAVDIDTEQITVTNDIATCTELKFSTTGSLPDPLLTDTVYYAIKVDATHIKVASNPVNAAAGTAINLLDIGSGTHTVDIGGGSSETERQEAINRAEQLIEKLTKDFFYAKSFEEYFDGSGSNKLFLNYYPDILSITEVLIYEVELDSSWYTHDKDTIYLDPSSGGGDEVPELLYRLGQKEVLFPKDDGNIKVTGTYGWSSCPPAIKRATIILVNYENDPTLYEAYNDFSAEKLGDHSINLGTRKFLTGIAEADNLIRPFIRKKPSLGVA
jgi:hypothetical protein